MGTVCSISMCPLQREGRTLKDIYIYIYMLILSKAALIPFPNFGSSDSALAAEKSRSAALTIDGDTCGVWTPPSWSPGLKKIQGREIGIL